MSTITGRTRLCAIVADPVVHVKTPAALNELVLARGFDAVMVPMHVGADELASVVAGLRALRNFAGFIATLPHKTAMPALCDHVSDRAKAVGAANVVRRNADGTLSADMLDGLGFVEGLKKAGIEVAGRSAYLAGAGGAASAIALALAEAGVSRLTIGNRTKSRSEALVQRLAERGYAHAVAAADGDPSGHDLVVNGTSLGMQSTDAYPLDVTKLASTQVVAEVIMAPVITPLMAAAQQRGCRVQPGYPMLAAQLELMADFMGFGARSPAQAA